MLNLGKRPLVRSTSQPAASVHGSFSEWEDPFPGFSTQDEAGNSSLSHYLWVLKRYCWRIAAFVALAVLITANVSLYLTPYYESTATVDVDVRAPTGVIGQDAVRGTPGNDVDGFLYTQVKLIQSDSVLRPVVERFKLYNDVVDFDATAQSGGGRGIDAPIVLKRLKVNRAPNTYLLQINYRSPNPKLAATVANAIAQSYIDHTYETRLRASANLSAFMEKQLLELKNKIEKSAAALVPFERELNVIDPDQKTNILSSRLLQLNTELTNVQVERIGKEATVNTVAGGSLEAAQTSPQGEQLRLLSARLDEARERFALVRMQYGTNHPEYKKAASQVTELERQVQDRQTNIAARVSIEHKQAADREQMLKNAVARTKTEFDALNARSVGYKALKQEAETDKTLYQELVRKIKEAGINANFQNSAIRLADAAHPARKPASPLVTLNIVLAFFASTVLAAGAALVADLLDRSLRDPEKIQTALRTQVISALPAVKSWDGSPRLQNNSRVALITAGAAGTTTGPSPSYEEAIRILHSSVSVPGRGFMGHRLLITSAVAAEGKTTTAVHLAIAHSLQKHKTLLIDGDLRNPRVHQLLGVSNGEGLSNVVQRESTWRDALHVSETYPNLSIVAAGPWSIEAVHQLGNVLNDILNEAEPEYDLIVVDSPPVLGCAEPLDIARLVDSVVMVALAGQTNRDAAANAIERLRRIGANVIGLVLNKVQADVSERYHYYSHGEQYYMEKGTA